MFKSELEKFVATKAIALLMLFSILDIILLNSRWFVLIGITIGTVLSVFKFISYAWILRKTLCDSLPCAKNRTVAKCIFVFTVNQLILLPFLFWAYFLNHWLFTGLIAGALSVPFVLMVNIITEALGITKNRFYI